MINFLTINNYITVHFEQQSTLNMHTCLLYTPHFIKRMYAYQIIKLTMTHAAKYKKIYSYSYNQRFLEKNIQF